MVDQFSRGAKNYWRLHNQADSCQDQNNVQHIGLFYPLTEEYSAVDASEHCGGGADHGQVPQGHSLSGIIEYANGNKPQEWSGYQQFSAALGKWI